MKDGNKKPWQVWEKRVEGSQKAKDRMGRAYVTTDMEKREDFAEGNLAGEGKESVHLADTTQCQTGNKVFEDEEPEKSLVNAMNKSLDIPTHSPVTLLTNLSQL
jgi:hypothetical protein